MQRIMLGVVAVAAVAGWITAFYALKGTDDAKEKLTATKAELSAVNEKLLSSQNRLRLQQDAAGRLEEINERIGAIQAESATLTGQIKTKSGELRALEQKVEAGESELASVTRQIEARKSALANLKQDVEKAKAESNRLRSERDQALRQSPAPGTVVGAIPQVPATPKAESQSPTAGSLAEPTTKAPAAPKAISQPSSAKETATAAKNQDIDQFADARRRFRKVDQNRDDKIDPMEFRLKKISVLSLIDVNRDGHLTIDETLVSPDVFKKFDIDGDGKISSLEFADAPTFRIIDANRDKFVTFEEYLRFLRIPTQ